MSHPDPDPGPEPGPEAPPPATLPSLAEIIASPVIQSAARWFWWIAGLSLVNTFMALSGSASGFVMGLGITAIADSIASQARALAFAVDLVALGFFVTMGLYASRGKLWAFWLGMAAYALDGLIYLMVGAWLPVLFHGLALYFIWRGASLLARAEKHFASQ